MLESALARPVNGWNYGRPDFAALAAAYAFGIGRNHPLVDGNKRTAWVLARLFLAEWSGTALRSDRGYSDDAFVGGGGELAEDELAAWFRERIVAG
jgi:death-on-curing protein